MGQTWLHALLPLHWKPRKASEREAIIFGGNQKAELYAGLSLKYWGKVKVKAGYYCAKFL